MDNYNVYNFDKVIIREYSTDEKYYREIIDKFENKLETKNFEEIEKFIRTINDNLLNNQLEICYLIYKYFENCEDTNILFDLVKLNNRLKAIIPHINLWFEPMIQLIVYQSGKEKSETMINKLNNEYCKIKIDHNENNNKIYSIIQGMIYITKILDFGYDNPKNIYDALSYFSKVNAYYHMMIACSLLMRNYKNLNYLEDSFIYYKKKINMNDKINLLPHLCIWKKYLKK